MDQEKNFGKSLENRTFKIALKLPSLNEYVNANRVNRYAGAKMKRFYEAKIGYFLRDMPHYDNPVKIHFTWVEGNKRRDLDNICFAKKFILDAMVKCGKLKDDNRRFVTAFTDSFEYGDETYVVLEVEEIG